MRGQQTPPLLEDALLRQLDAADFRLNPTLTGRFGGLRASAQPGHSVEWRDHDPYAPGDDLKRMDWRLAARTEKYYIRRYEDEQRLTHHIYVDMSGSMGMEGKGETALRLAAALGYLAVHRLDAVCLRLLRGKECRPLGEPLRTEEALFRCAAGLQTQDFQGETDLYAALRSDGEIRRGSGASFLLSDFLTESSWQTAVKLLLSYRRQVTLIRILSPREVSPSAVGYYDFDSVEAPADRLKMRVDRAALKAYQLAYDAWTEEMGRFCASHGVGLVCAQSDEAVGEILLKKGYQAGVIR